MIFIYLFVLLLVVLRLGLRKDHFYLLVGSVLLTFILAEGLSRLMGVGIPREVIWNEARIPGKGATPLYEPYGKLVYRYPDNPRGYFNPMNEVVGTINSLGFRGRESHQKKRTGGLRLAFLGDSFTLGVGVRDEDTFPAQVESQFGRQFESCEALNFGGSGFDTVDEIALLENFVFKFSPDIVVVVFFLNDTGRLGTVDFFSKPQFFLNARKYSHFLNGIISLLERRIQTARMIRHYHEGFDPGYPGYWRVQAALRRGKQLSEVCGFKLVVALYPVLYGFPNDYPFREIHKVLAAFCKGESIPFVDLSPAFEHHRASELWVHPLDQHPNEAAHRLAAARFVAYLKEIGYPNQELNTNGEPNKRENRGVKFKLGEG